MRIADPNFNPKYGFSSSRQYDQRYSCRIQIPIFSPPVFRGQKAPDPGSGSTTRALIKCVAGCLSVCSTTLWVGHLSRLVQEDELSDIFGTYGEVSRVHFLIWKNLPFFIINGCPYAGDIFTLKTVLQRTCVSLYIRNKIEIKYPAFEFSLTIIRIIYSHGELSAIHFTILLLVF